MYVQVVKSTLYNKQTKTKQQPTVVFTVANSGVMMMALYSNIHDVTVTVIQIYK